MKLSILASILPLFIVAIIGTFYLYQNRGYISKIDRISTQISAVKRSSELSEATKSIFNAVDGSGEIRKLMLSLKSIYIEGEAWGIPKLEANLKRLYPDGLFTIKDGKCFSFQVPNYSTILRFQKVRRRLLIGNLIGFTQF